MLISGQWIEFMLILVFLLFTCSLYCVLFLAGWLQFLILLWILFDLCWSCFTHLFLFLPIIVYLLFCLVFYILARLLLLVLSYQTSEIPPFLVCIIVLVGCDCTVAECCFSGSCCSKSLVFMLCSMLFPVRALVYLYCMFHMWCFLSIWYCPLLVFPMFFSWISSLLYHLHYLLCFLLLLLLLRILHVMLLIFSYGCFVVVRVVVQMFPIFSLHSSI